MRLNHSYFSAFTGSSFEAFIAGNIETRIVIRIEQAEIIKIGLELGVDYAKTWTCYEGQDVACGKCGSCNERLEAFEINNFIDPLSYNI
mgnify:CR=1 FL=1